ncbi:MAG: DNA translocase FtsK 4TM domain-containing protein [Candidatus Kaelpia aquatica]|nr:DNA translocase FtsK 4TM domain-containing protein [Candidatus Kaelpia aquatica]
MKKEILCLLGVAIGLYLFLAIIFFSPLSHPGLSSNGIDAGSFFRNITVLSGYFLRSYFGLMSIVIPVVIFFWTYMFYFYEEDFKHFRVKLLSFFLLICSLSCSAALLSHFNKEVSFNLSGIVGFYFLDFSRKYFGYSGAILVSLSILLLSAIMVTDLPLLSYIITGLKKLFFILIKAVSSLFRQCLKVKESESKQRFSKAEKEGILEFEDNVSGVKAVKKKPIFKIEDIEKPQRRVVLKQSKSVSRGGFTLPPIDLLESPEQSKDQEKVEDLHAKAELLEETLRDFNIEAKVVNIEKGPVITRYELQPAPGVKVQSIASLSEDIGLVMKSYNVHVSPVAGKGTIGVEIPNITSSMVYLKDIVGSASFHTQRSLLSLALGQKVSGEPLISDLSEMPHLLIAGTTGSGKTVCINALIISLLYRATPDEVKMILIDPKMVELMPFNGLPHLIVPVVTNASKAVSALEWAVAEMDARYRLLSKATTRNIESYNQKKDKDAELPQSLPYIVVVIDELADLMLVASKEIEGHIARLAQLSRAVGIHMILATQRPSVDVITGVIKANFPSRISFKVASKVDSRTVLDLNGADKLVGKGDMLFIPPGTSKPCRAQCSLVSDQEIERVVGFIKEQREPEYDDSILGSSSGAPGLKVHGKRDQVYKEAINVIMQTGQASVSMLQRRLGVGYTRAARLIDMMEEDNIVGSYQGSKPREILIDREEYLQDLQGAG